MKKAVRQFTIYAMLSIFTLLTILLFIINGVNFTMAAEDADRITAMLANDNGAFPKPTGKALDERRKTGNGFDGNDLGRFRTMGPSSPELSDTMRYFTVRIDKEGNAALVAFHINAVDEEDALAWAKSLQKERIGWTNRTYRYRVYRQDGNTFVTVIDQGRELLPSYRILLISVIGEVLSLAVALLILLYSGKQLFRPIEEADRKQKRFIAETEPEFQTPLLLIDQNAEAIERQNGPSEPTRTIHQQVRKLNVLVQQIGTLAIYNEMSAAGSVRLSEILDGILLQNNSRFVDAGVVLQKQIEPDIQIPGDAIGLASAIDELVENALRYAKTYVLFQLVRENSRVTLTASNDSALPDGNVEQVFDRYTTLENGKGQCGLGLSRVKEIVKASNGRVSATVENGVFTVRVDL